MSVRAHVVLPEELVLEVDTFAGRRKRSQFVEAAIREKLSRERLGRALEHAAGAVDVAEYPHWKRPEDVSAWVRSSRSEDDARLARQLRERGE